MKRAIKIAGAAVVALLLALIGGFVWIDSIAKIGVEKGATFALGVQTTLGGMNIGVLSGQAGMSELNVANPQGFTTPHFLQLGAGNIAVSLGSLMGDTVVVPELALSSVIVNLERKGAQSNYQVILDSLKRFESKSGGQAPQPQQKDQAEGKKFVVKRAVMTDLNVQVDVLPVGGKISSIPLKIERIELKDIGSGSAGGVQLAELSGILVKAILSAVVQKGGNIIPADIAGELSSGLAGLQGLSDSGMQVLGDVTTIIDGESRKVSEVSQQFLQGLGKGTEDAGKAVEDTVKNATGKFGESLGGLLPKKDNENANDNENP